MSSENHDGALAAAYASGGSETAFRALVARHVDLVFATAMRQVGDRGVAEEIAQNVFIALARKAPRLAGYETLAGWLHRTTTLESKARVRAELRRRAREEKAAELAVIDRQEASSSFEAVLPLLDEALLNLRETDRVALLLRFIEGRSLQEVGSLLGIDEDAARKRVARALQRLGGFFQSRGLAVPAGAAAVMSYAAQAAPAGLAASAAQAGLVVGSAGGINLFILHAMTISKTQTAVLCALAVGAPLLWQQRAHGEMSRTQSALAGQIAIQERALAGLRSQQATAIERLQRVQTEESNAEAQLALLPAQREGRLSAPRYRWDDDSDVLRVPKQLMNRLELSSIADKKGTLTAQMKAALQLKEEETARVEEAMREFLEGFYSAQAETLRPVGAVERDLAGRKREETRVFEAGDMKERVKELRGTLFAQIREVLGADRFEQFRHGLRDWMPLDEERRGLNTGMGVIEFPHRVRFYQPLPGDTRIGWGITELDGGSMTATISLEEIPVIYLGYLTDWIELARSRLPTENPHAEAP